MTWTKGDLLDARRAYRRWLESRPLAQATIDSHDRYSGFFVGWLYGDYAPRGATARRDALAATLALDTGDLRRELDAYGPYLVAAGLNVSGVPTYVEGARLFAKWLDPAILSGRQGPRVEAARTPALAQRIVQPVSQGPSDWYWEGNVQTVLVRWLKAQGYTIESIANTAIKEQGDDIRARRAGSVLRVEVKGWPTKGRYADPMRASEVKRTQPSTQAGHWYSQAVLHVLRDLGRHPRDAVAIGLPDWPRFRSLVDDTEAPLRRLGVAVWFVGQDGEVEERLPLGQPR